MATKKEPSTARYRVLRDTTIPASEPGGQGQIVVAGDVVEIGPDVAAILVRDGMVTPEEV